MIDTKLKIISLAVLIAVGAGCRREEVRVYTAPKDAPPRQEVANDPHEGHDHGQEAAARPRPKLSWKLPEGWRETAPDRMNVASFAVTGAGGQEAQVKITPLPMLAGRDAMIVNMWREQVGLKPLTEEEMANQLQDVTDVFIRAKHVRPYNWLPDFCDQARVGKMRRVIDQELLIACC